MRTRKCSLRTERYAECDCCKLFPTSPHHSSFSPLQQLHHHIHHRQSKMKVEIDSFSGGKIYPGRGRLFVRGDSKVFRFGTAKSERLFKQRKNPRRISWTVLYRRQHKKGVTEEVHKKKARKAIKSQRAIVGASLDVIKERRSQRPEVRQAARSQAILNAKEKKKEAESKKKADRAKNPKQQKIVSKQSSKGFAGKVQATSR